MKGDAVVGCPEVASHDDWARLELYGGGQNGTERVKGGSGKELRAFMAEQTWDWCGMRVGGVR